MSDIGPESERDETSEPATASSQDTTTGRDQETNQWAMIIHFSVLAGWVVPVAGIVVPIFLWQLKKDELPGIVPHAHIVINWILSSLIYAVVCFILLFVFIGILGFFVLAVLTFIYSIIGGIKANEGEIWEYPGTIVKLFK